MSAPRSVWVSPGRLWSIGELHMDLGKEGAAKPQLMESLCEGGIWISLCRHSRLSAAVNHQYINPTDCVLMFVRAGIFRSLC